MSNLISFIPDIRVTTVVRVTKEDEIDIRNCEICVNSVKAVRHGDQSQKKLNYYRLPNAMLPKGKDSAHRCNDELISNGRVLLDYDVHDGGIAFYEEKIRGHEEELNIFHAELSPNKGLHLDVPIIDGLSRKETIHWYSLTLGVEFDTACQDLARACFLVPQSDVLYDTDEYYEGCSEPQKQDLSVLYEEEQAEVREELMEHFISDLGDGEIETTAIVDDDIEMDEVKTSTLDELLTDEDELDPECLTQSSKLTAQSSVPEYHREYEDDYDECQRIIDLVCKAKIDLTKEEPIWWRLGVAIWNCMGYDGVEEYQRLSQFYPNYNQKETQEKFNNIAQRDYDRITLGTLVYICKKAGLFS